MTIELRNELGDSLYSTLTNGLAWQYSTWLEWKKVEGHRYQYRLIKSIGVDELSGWSQEDLDGLSGIGPTKANRIYEALQQRHQSEGPLLEEDNDSLSPGDPFYFPE